MVALMIWLGTVLLFMEAFGKQKDIWHKRSPAYSCGLLFNLDSGWIGCHYSAYNKRYCINLVPCFTFWITKRGGVLPNGDRA